VRDQSRRRNVVASALAYSLEQIVQRSLGVVTGVLMARYLGPDVELFRSVSKALNRERSTRNLQYLEALSRRGPDARNEFDLCPDSNLILPRPAPDDYERCG
jgi:hypothetical protein